MMGTVYAGDYAGFFRREGYQYTLEKMPACSEVHEGLVYDTQKATLLAYSLKNDWTSPSMHSVGVIWDLDYDGIYRTQAGRYFRHHYSPAILYFNYIVPLSEQEAQKAYFECEHKIVELSIAEA